VSAIAAVLRKALRVLRKSAANSAQEFDALISTMRMIDARSGRLGIDQVGRFAGLHAAPELLFRRDQYAEIGSYQERLSSSVAAPSCTMRLPDRSSGAASPRFSRRVNMKLKPSTSAQIRAARALIRWSAEDLARESNLGVTTIRRAEFTEAQTSMTTANDLAVRRALEAAGVEFIDDNGGGPGVRLRRRQRSRATKI